MHPEYDSTDQPDQGRSNNSLPSNWMEAVAALIQTRLTLILIEFRELAQERVRSLVSLVIAAILLFYTWGLILAGGVAAIAALTQWPWYWIALITAGIHLLIAIILVKLPKAEQKEPFSITRSEFKKDREWIETLKKTPKSKN